MATYRLVHPLGSTVTIGRQFLQQGRRIELREHDLFRHSGETSESQAAQRRGIPAPYHVRAGFSPE